MLVKQMDGYSGGCTRLGKGRSWLVDTKYRPPLRPRGGGYHSGDELARVEQPPLSCPIFRFTSYLEIAGSIPGGGNVLIN